MSDASLRDLDRRVLEELCREFPVDPFPYCVLAERIGADELDVLNSALKLREIGLVTSVMVRLDVREIPFCSLLETEAGADAEAGARQSGVELSCDEAELAGLLQDDLPWGEHPYAELAAMLSMRGVDVDEDFVIDTIKAWQKSGLVRGVAARG